MEVVYRKTQKEKQKEFKADKEFFEFLYQFALQVFPEELKKEQTYIMNVCLTELNKN